MKFTIISYIPARQEGKAFFLDRAVIDECEANTIKEIMDGLHIPKGGYCLIANTDDLIKITNDGEVEI